MIRGDRDEYCCGDCQPVGREVVTLERSPRHNHSEQGDNQPGIAQADMNFLEVGNTRFANLQTLDVFFGGRHRLEGSRLDLT